MLVIDVAGNCCFYINFGEQDEKNFDILFLLRVKMCSNFMNHVHANFGLRCLYVGVLFTATSFYSKFKINSTGPWFTVRVDWRARLGGGVACGVAVWACGGVTVWRVTVWRVTVWRVAVWACGGVGVWRCDRVAV